MNSAAASAQPAQTYPGLGHETRHRQAWQVGIEKRLPRARGCPIWNKGEGEDLEPMPYDVKASKENEDN